MSADRRPDDSRRAVSISRKERRCRHVDLQRCLKEPKLIQPITTQHFQAFNSVSGGGADESNRPANTVNKQGIQTKSERSAGVRGQRTSVAAMEGRGSCGAAQTTV